MSKQITKTTELTKAQMISELLKIADELNTMWYVCANGLVAGLDKEEMNNVREAINKSALPLDEYLEL